MTQTYRAPRPADLTIDVSVEGSAGPDRGARAGDVPETPMDATSVLSLGALADPVTDPRMESAAAQVAALPAHHAALLVLHGSRFVAMFLLDHDVTRAGRHPDGDIFLDDVTVSRRHAEFHRDGGTFTVRDLGSLNGTFLNRDRVQEAELTSGDEVQIGKYRLVFVTGS